MFYLGQNKDYSPGDSTLVSSERLLRYSPHWGSGGRSIYKILVKEEFSALKCLLSAGHKDQMLSWRNLPLFYLWGDAKIGIMKSVPENTQLSKDLSHQIPPNTEYLTPPWTPSGGVEGQ